jgi:hypothetical protein
MIRANCGKGQDQASRPAGTLIVPAERSPALRRHAYVLGMSTHPQGDAPRLRLDVAQCRAGCGRGHWRIFRAALAAWRRSDVRAPPPAAERRVMNRTSLRTLVHSCVRKCRHAEFDPLRAQRIFVTVARRIIASLPAGAAQGPARHDRP